MLKPYVVDRIVYNDSNKTLYTGKREEVATIASENTIEKLKELMTNVINGDNTNSTGYAYYMDGYTLIGKTGTAQIYDYSKGNYMTGDSDYIYSFSGLFPKEEPEIIIYAAIRRPKDTINYLAPMVKEVEKNITKYLNIEDSSNDKMEYKVESFYNRSTNDIKKYLENMNIEVLLIGNGNKIVDQYPSMNTTIYEDDLVILKTNDFDNKMIDLTGYSHKEVVNILKFMNVSYLIEGTGYVYEQSILPNVNIDDKITVKLKEKYKEG